jgi:hypothetical protein
MWRAVTNAPGCVPMMAIRFIVVLLSMMMPLFRFGVVPPKADSSSF